MLPTPYHEVFWLAVVLCSVLLALGHLGIALRGLRYVRKSDQATVVVIAALAVVVLVTTFAIGMTCLALRRDFVRPLFGTVVMAIAFAATVGLIAGMARDRS